MKRLILFFTVALMAASTVGCGGMESANTKGTTSTRAVTPVVPNPWVNGTDGNNLSNDGASTQLHTTAALMKLFTGHPVAQADSVQLTVQLDNFQDDKFSGHYIGYMSVSYDNNGEYKNPMMWTGESDHDTQYNIWYTDTATGKRVFHGFFEDEPPAYPETQTAGGIILVIDDVVSLGDGAAPLDSVGGSVWFKNYRVAAWTKPDTRCWFIQIGPYECQSWLVNGGKSLDPRRQVDPDNGYQKLGTFTGLNARGAFNMQ